MKTKHPSFNTTRWRQGYQRGQRSWGRDNRSTMLARLRILGVPRLAPEARILDFGCGDGMVLRCLAELGFRRLVGLEPDYLLLDCDSPGLKLAGRGPGLPFKDQSFDAVIVQSVLHHLPHAEALGGTVADFARILRPAGRLFYCEPDHTPLRRLLTPLLLSPLARLSRFARQKRLMVLEEQETLERWLELERRFPRDFLVPAGFRVEMVRRGPLKTFVRAVKVPRPA